MDILILDPIDVDRIIELEETLSNESLCYKSHKSRIVESINSNCSTGAFANGLLVAYSLCYNTEYGTAYVEKCFVHEDYRGLGLQVEMLLKNISLCEAKGVTIFHTMAAPNNFISIRSFEKVGFVKSRTINFGKYERTILHRGDYKTNSSKFVSESTKFLSGGYVYIYGGKGSVITESFVKKISELYPSMYSEDVTERAYANVGRLGIDCSGLVTIAANMPNINTDALYEYIEIKYPISDLSEIESGMVVWVEGHIGVVSKDENNNMFIIEAKDSERNIIISPLSERINSFKCYGRLSNITYPN